MNIATPGPCNLSPCEYLDVQDEDSFAPNLNADILDDALFDSLQGGWPALRRISLTQAWEWLHGDLAYDIHIENTVSDEVLSAVIYGHQHKAPIALCAAFERFMDVLLWDCGEPLSVCTGDALLR